MSAEQQAAETRIVALALAAILAASAVWPAAAPAVQNSHQFNQSWLILGPYYRKNTGAAPGLNALRQDYLTDGPITQDNLIPTSGLVIYTNYALRQCGSFSLVWRTLANGHDVPAIFSYADPDDTINLRGEGAGSGDPGVFNQGNDQLGQGTNRLDNTMVYAWAFLNNKTGATTTTYLGIGSDDSIVVHVNGVERLIFQGNRAFGNANEVRTAAGPFPLNPGYNLVMVKAFNGWGRFGFRCRIQGTVRTGVNEADGIPPGLVGWELQGPGYTYPPRPTPPDSAAAYRTLGASLNYTPGTPVRVDVKVTTTSGHPGNVRVREWPPDGWTLATPTATLGSATVVTTATARGSTSIIRWDVGPLGPDTSNSAVLTYWITPPVGANRDFICTGTVTSDAQRPTERDAYLFAPSSPAGLFDWTGDLGDPFIGRRLTSQSQTALLPVWFGPDSILTGDPRHVGQTAVSGSSYTLTASGTEIFNDRDRCRLTAKRVTGSFILTADIRWTSMPGLPGQSPYRIDGTDGCKAALMVRGTASPGACEAAAGIRNYYRLAPPAESGSFFFQWRNTAWGGSSGGYPNNVRTTTQSGGVIVPSRIRLVRRGSQIEPYHFFQGTWAPHPAGTHVVTQLTTEPVLACLAVTSRSNNTSVTAEFSNVSIAPLPLVSATRSFWPRDVYSTSPMTVRVFLKHGGGTADLRVRDFAPTSWTVINASNGGAVDRGSTVTWSLPAFSADTTLTYVISPDLRNRIAPAFFGPGFANDLTNSISGPPIGGKDVLPADRVTTFQQGRFPNANCAGAKDCNLIQAYGGTRNNGWNDELEEGDNQLGNDDARMPLLRFDVGYISPALIVFEARLLLLHERNRAPVGGPHGTSGTIHRIYAARLNRPWGEGRGTGFEGSYANRGEVCWNGNAAFLQSWSSPGARGGALDTAPPESYADISSATVGTWVSWDVTRMVYEWVRTPGQNYGLRLSQEDRNTTHLPIAWPAWQGTRYAGGVCSFASKDSPVVTKRPLLVVLAYLPVPV